VGNVGVGRLGDEARGQRHLHDQGGPRFVDVQLAGHRLEVAHGQPAAAQDARRLHAPVVEQQLHASYDVEGRTRGRPGDQRGVARRRGQRGHLVDRLPGRAATAEGEAHLARQHDGITLAGHEQAPADELLGRRPGLGRRHGASRRTGGALPAVVVHVAQQGGRGRGQLGDPRRDLLGPRGLGAGGSQPADQARHAPHRVGHTGERPHAAGRLPGEGQVEQALQRRRRARLVGVHDRDQVRRSGLTRNQEGIKHGKLQAVQAVEGAMDRRPCGSPRGQLRGILRGGCGEIWTGPEQRHEPVVRPAAQLVGEGACGCRPR
jgi:hypothetical protein